MFLLSKITSFVKAFSFQRAASIFWGSIDKDQVGAQLLTFPGTTVHIPRIVHVCCTYLRRKGHNNHKIFSLPGKKTRVRKLLGLFEDNQIKSAAQLEEMNFKPVDVAEVLICYFDCLPQAIISHDMCMSFHLVMRYLKAHEFIQVYKKYINEMPGPKHDLLLYMLDFLHDLSQFSYCTGMDKVYLATIFQPHILSDPNSYRSPNPRSKNTLLVKYLLFNYESIASLENPILSKVYYPQPREQLSPSKSAPILTSSRV